MKQYLVVITCDVNDGDYIKSHFRATEGDLEMIKKALSAVQKLKQSYYELRKNLNLHTYLSYKDNLPYYGDMMTPILQKYEWCYADEIIKHLEWVNSIPEEDTEDALYLYRLLPYFDNEKVHTIVEIEAYEITGEKLDLI